MRVGDKQYGTLDLGTNNLTTIGSVQKALSSGVAFWKLIQEVRLDADTATIEFNGIPQEFRHLVLVTSLQFAGVADMNCILRFNGDITANYDTAWFGVTDAAVLVNSGADGPGKTFIEIPVIADTATRPCVIQIVDYANTTRHKAATSIGGIVLAATAGNIRTDMSSGRWRNTAAITTVTLAPNSGSFKSGSMASLYGTDV